MKTIKPILLLLAGALIVLATLWFQGSDDSLGATGALTTFTNPINFDQAVTLDSTLVVTGATTLSSTVGVTGAVTVDEFTQGGGILNISTTSATYTLTQAELAAANVIEVEAVALAEALTLTLPATSTMTTLLPSAGDAREWFLKNKHTGAATTTTIAAGTGIDLQEPDGQNVVIGITNIAIIKCYREENTDVVCSVDEHIPGDA